ncbi:glucose-1-phosphate adenylyltransferase [Pseudoxanthobacter sp. M-2]|uniref:glucose-1-phosphate adenylyltransferase n=1 Tax=Pseudoxanthobacter sp. M-2 TaxID=3078754 RepID=UPI0038FD23B8
MSEKRQHAPLARSAMAYVLAGGRGSRLLELTDNRAKPAVYFGGKTRIIDFALSNALNSGVRRMAVATQYKAHSLIRHLNRGWNFLRQERNEGFDILPASQRVSEDRWYAGTADAVYQNLDIIEGYEPEYLIILAGDHVYKMDYEKMLDQHVAEGADVTVACVEVPQAEATAFGVMHVDENDRIISFLEKPANPPEIPGQPGLSLASMGIYVFSRKLLFDQLRRDAEDPNSAHDFGKDIIPFLVENATAVAHRFSKSCVRSPSEPGSYWRDVGTIDAYYDANLDLTEVVPSLDIYDRDWPIWTYSEITPPAKFVHDEDGRRGMGVSSLVAGGCIISGARIHKTLLSTGVHLHSYADVDYSVILPNVDVGRGARLRGCVVDANVKIPDGLVVGEDPEEDGRRFRRTERGVVLITQPMIDRLGV